MATLRSIGAHFVLLGSSLVAAFLVLELCLRIIYPAPIRFVYPQEMYDVDPELGHVLRPEQTAYTHDRVVRTNSQGLRAPEIAPRPARGTLRVLALGDSQTFGNGLDLSETWPQQLEQRLQAARGDRWEVVNAGIPGTDTWQHEILLRRLLAALHPHAVVLALYVNDVVPRNNPRGGAQASTLNNTWGKHLIYLLKRSSVISWAYYVLLPSYERVFAGDNSVEEAVLSGKSDPGAERGWRQVEHSLTEMKELCDAHGVGLLVTILPRRDQVSGHHPGRAYNERVRKIAESHGIALIDVLPSLSAEYRVHRDKLFIPWDGHNSANANQVISARIAEVLKDFTALRPTSADPTQPVGRSEVNVQRRTRQKHGGIYRIERVLRDGEPLQSRTVSVVTRSHGSGSSS